jgi:hypothetical protein
MITSLLQLHLTIFTLFLIPRPKLN